MYVWRVDMMTSDIQKTLADRLGSFQAFSIALDEITDLSETAQLALFDGGVDEEF